MAKLFQKVQLSSEQTMQRELARAHLMIMLLALTLVALLLGITAFDMVLDRTLATIAGLAASIVAVLSLIVYVYLSTKLTAKPTKKK